MVEMEMQSGPLSCAFFRAHRRRAIVVVVDAALNVYVLPVGW